MQAYALVIYIFVQEPAEMDLNPTHSGSSRQITAQEIKPEAASVWKIIKQLLGDFYIRQT